MQAGLPGKQREMEYLSVSLRNCSNLVMIVKFSNGEQ